MNDPLIRNLAMHVPQLDKLIAAQRARAATLPPEKCKKLLHQVAQLERKVELARQRDES